MSNKKPDAERIRSVKPFGLRLLPSLKHRLEASARTNGRSLNAEISARLSASLEAAA